MLNSAYCCLSFISLSIKHETVLCRIALRKFLKSRSPLAPFGHCSSSGRLESFPNTPQTSTVNVIFDILGGVVFVYDCTECGPRRA